MTSRAHDTVIDPAVEVELSYRTDPGRDPEKQVNEDSGFHKVTRFGTLCVVCDGMGGHANGQDASRAAVTAIEETFDQAPEGSVGRDLLRAGITLGHERIRALPLAAGEARSGSTVVAVLVTPHGAELAHVGDSRIYFVSRGQISQVTRDHSMVQLMVEAGMIKPEEAATHPDANKIMRALGISTTVEVDVRPEPLPFGPGDVFVLASDGLTDLVSDVEILQIAGSMPGEQAVGQLVDLANARGGHDNITVLLARPREGSHGHAGSSGGVPVTANDSPLEPGRSSPATVLAAPLPLPAPTPSSQGAAPAQATAMVAPLALPGMPAAPQAPAASGMPGASGSGQGSFVAPPPPPPSRPRRRGTPPALLALLALVGVVMLVAAAVGLYTLVERPKRHEPQIIVPLSALPFLGDDAAAPAPPSDPSVAPPAIPSTDETAPHEHPALAPPPSTGVRHHRKEGGVH